MCSFNHSTMHVPFPSEAGAAKMPKGRVTNAMKIEETNAKVNKMMEMPKIPKMATMYRKGSSY